MTEDAVLGRRRRRRPWISLPLSSVLILVLGWAALWLFARHEAAKVMDTWIGLQAERGQTWTCPGREIGGFPFRIRISCARPTFRGKLGRDAIRATLPAFRAETFLYQPNAVEASAEGPLTVHRQNGESDTTLSWSALHLTLRGLTAARRRAALTIEAPELKQSDRQGSRADRLEVHVGPAAGKPPEESDYDVWLTLTDARVPELDPLTGNGDPASLDEKGVLKHFDPTGLAPWQELVEEWREAGGAFDLSSLKLSKGPLRIDAQGNLGLDDGHRLAGRLKATLAGYEPLALQLGIPLPALSVGGALANLLTRNPSAPSGGSDGSGITLPIVLTDGRVIIGPVKTGLRLPPLY